MELLAGGATGLRGRGGREQGGGCGSDFFAGDVTLHARSHHLNLAVAKGGADEFDHRVPRQLQVWLEALPWAVAKKGRGINRDREKSGGLGGALRGLIGAAAPREQRREDG